ncbi:MAG TPA: FGGY family carbohydrate kinase, partial [Roseiflexaceae bacterium]|nr:FGGY family carbohydrate kinase [Roseiflexaceae bacterium]
MSSIDRAAAVSPFVLTIDIGSSSTRALLYDAQARRVDGIAARTTYQIATSSDGASEIDAEWLLDCVCRCLDSVLDQTGDLQIAGVALDTFVSNIIALDATGKPLSQVVTYADTRNDDDSRRLRHELDETQVHERTGCLLRTSYWPARLAWFRRTQPALWEATRHWATFGEYLELRLFGHGRAGISAASWSGLVDRRSNQWDHELLDFLGVARDYLAPLVDSGQPLRGLNSAYANRWPALRDVPWFPALGDGAAANIGSGCDNPQRIALTVGTTA